MSASLSAEHQRLIETVREQQLVPFRIDEAIDDLAAKLARLEAVEQETEWACAHDHHWRMTETPSRCPVCGTSTFRALADGGQA